MTNSGLTRNSPTGPVSYFYKSSDGSESVIAVGDSSYAVIDLLKVLQGRVSLISWLRSDAALYEPIPVQVAGKRGRKRLKGQRLPTLMEVASDKRTQWEPFTVTDSLKSNV